MDVLFNEIYMHICRTHELWINSPLLKLRTESLYFIHVMSVFAAKKHINERWISKWNTPCEHAFAWHNGGALVSGLASALIYGQYFTSAKNKNLLISRVLFKLFIDTCANDIRLRPFPFSIRTTFLWFAAFAKLMYWHQWFGFVNTAKLCTEVA